MLFGKGTKKESKQNIDPSKPVTGTKTNSPSVQAWLPFHDIKNQLIWRRDKHIVSGVYTGRRNIFLLSKDEQKNAIHQLFEVINSLGIYHVIHTTQRPVDLDAYIAELENLRNEETNYMRRRILDSTKRNSSLIASSGEATELHYYIFLTSQITEKNVNTQMEQLLSMTLDLAEGLKNAELLDSHICTNQELREVNFAFLNPIYAGFERAPEHSLLQLPPIYSTEIDYE